MVLAACLGVGGFLRLSSPLDRLHAASFVAVVCGFLLVVVAFLADGASQRAFKILLVWLVTLLSGGASAHAIGRALLLRGDVPEAEPAAALPPRRYPARPGAHG
ncbi:MAG: monovalent cation/H(+) antiporter subunit G [Gluconacetobacter diazotrophicus]|nr:monovalent cation/H(+) antiporter subunit G [Gluconacetobacter diazotrophicus]